MKQSIIRAVVTIGALALSGAVGAQTPGTQTPGKTTSGTTTQTKAATSTKSGDTKFVREAAMGGLAEVELGRLATQKAQSSEVKQFGQRMVDDHSKANDSLKPIAQEKNVPVPTQLSVKEKALYDRLSKLSGEALDRAYMRAMVSDHKKDVSAFRHESTSGKDASVKQFASQTLPTLEEHLKLAQTTQGATATSGRKQNGGTTTTGTTGTTGGTRPPSPGTTGTPSPTTPGGASEPGRR